MIFKADLADKVWRNLYPNDKLTNVKYLLKNNNEIQDTMQAKRKVIYRTVLIAEIWNMRI